MIHTVSATYKRFERMSPSALVLAVLLHGAVMVAWWWASPLDAHDQLDEAIEVTMDAPTPTPNPQIAAAEAPPAVPTPPPSTPAPTPTPTRPTPPPRLGLNPLGGAPDATKPAHEKPAGAPAPVL